MSRLKEHYRLTPKQAKKYKQLLIGTAAVVGVGCAIYFGYKHASITQMAGLAQAGNLTTHTARSVMLQTLDDGDQILREGDIVHRMSAYADVDYSQATKPLYVSFKDTDVAVYMTMLRDWSGTGKRYDVTLRALKDLRIPSEQKARQLFDELWTSDPEYREKLASTVVDAYIKLGVDPFSAKMRVQQDLKQDPFKVAIYSIVKDKEDTAMWIGKLRNAGYDAIIDYFDKGEMADSPLIVLDPKSTLQKTGERFVTQQMKLDTVANLKARGITRIPGTKRSVGEMEWLLSL